MNRVFKIKLISWQNLILLTIFYVLIFILISKVANYPSDVPDLLFSYSADTLLDILKSYTPDDISSYINSSLYFDFIYPISYALLLFVFISLLFKVFKLNYYWLISIKIFPFIALFFDYLENIAIIRILLQLPDYNYFILQIASYSTSFKWFFIVSAIPITLSIIVFYHFKKLLCYNK